MAQLCSLPEQPSPPKFYLRCCLKRSASITSRIPTIKAVPCSWCYHHAEGTEAWSPTQPGSGTVTLQSSCSWTNLHNLIVPHERNINRPLLALLWTCFPIAFTLISCYCSFFLLIVLSNLCMCFCVLFRVFEPLMLLQARFYLYLYQHLTVLAQVTTNSSPCCLRQRKPLPVSFTSLISQKVGELFPKLQVIIPYLPSLPPPSPPRFPVCTHSIHLEAQSTCCLQ